MKKHFLIAVAALIAGTSAVYAQQSVVKEAERAQKQGKSPEEVVAIIKPAFTDPETANSALTYLIPGRAYFSQYDDLTKKQIYMKDFPENGKQIMANDLINGYDFFMKALAVDTVVNSKGKVEHKYSKEIANTIIGSAPYFFQSASEMYNEKNYDASYKLFDIYTSIYAKEPLASVKKADPNYSIPETYFNQGIVAWQADDQRNALNAFTNARKAGYTEKIIYDYALTIANALKDKDAILEWATIGNELYGAEDPNYLGNIINVYLQDQKFDEAFNLIDHAIEVNPSNPQYYFIKGVLYDNQDKRPEAKAMFKKTIELDPENSEGLTQYGNSLFLEGCAIIDAAPANLSVAETQKMFNDNVRPLFEEAATYLEKAYSLNPDNTGALRVLENIYYNLNDEAKYNDVRARLAGN